MGIEERNAKELPDYFKPIAVDSPRGAAAVSRMGIDEPCRGLLMYRLGDVELGCVLLVMGAGLLWAMSRGEFFAGTVWVPYLYWGAIALLATNIVMVPHAILFRHWFGFFENTFCFQTGGFLPFTCQNLTVEKKDIESVHARYHSLLSSGCPKLYVVLCLKSGKEVRVMQGEVREECANALADAIHVWLDEDVVTGEAGENTGV